MADIDVFLIFYLRTLTQRRFCLLILNFTECSIYTTRPQDTIPFYQQIINLKFAAGPITDTDCTMCLLGSANPGFLFVYDLTS